MLHRHFTRVLLTVLVTGVATSARAQVGARGGAQPGGQPIVPTDIRIPAPDNFRGREWVYHVPEFQDYQRFNERQYHAYVRAVASPDLDLYDLPKFDAWTLAGMILVDTWSKHVTEYYAVRGPNPLGAAVTNVPLPPAPNIASLTRLNLRAGWNCAYFRHTGTSNATGWSAAITQPTTNSTVVTCVEPVAPMFHVVAAAPSADPQWYPPVARIFELPDALYGMGFRCASGWCTIMPEGASVIPAPIHETLGLPSPTKQWRVPGWYDIQHLAFARAPTANYNQLQPAMNAQIVADSQLANWTVDAFISGRRQVATIVLADRPQAKYKDHWGLKRGTTRVEIRLDNAAKGWAWLIAPDGSEKKFPVHRVDHHEETPRGIPKVARWAWIDSDDAIWIECDVGCCYIDAK